MKQKLSCIRVPHIAGLLKHKCSIPLVLPRISPTTTHLFPPISTIWRTGAREKASTYFLGDKDFGVEVMM